MHELVDSLRFCDHEAGIHAVWQPPPRIGKQLLEENARTGETGGAEKDPCQIDKQKGQKPAERLGQTLLCEVVPNLSEGERKPMQTAPDDESPAGTMPQSGEQKHHHGIEAGADKALAGAAERDI